MTAPDLFIVPIEGKTDRLRDLQIVIGDAMDYALLVTGSTPAPGDAERAATALPAGRSCADKYIFVAYVSDAPVGCADLIRGYPNGRTAFIGLLLIAEKYRSQGLGRRLYRDVERIIQGWPETSAIELAGVETNASVEDFWEKNGFCPTGKRKAYCHNDIRSESILFEKKLERTGSP